MCIDDRTKPMTSPNLTQIGSLSFDNAVRMAHFNAYCEGQCQL